MSSPEFYDDFLSYQLKSGINDRIYSLYKRLKKSGLHAGTNLWEIGCGIGCLTYLLSRTVAKGKIEAIDLSPKSVAYAKEHLNKQNISFTACDVFDYTPAMTSFDKILLFDVLEHVPEENHERLFKKIQGYMTDESQLLINLPNPGHILHDQKNNPGILQETDQPIFIENLSCALAKASLEIVVFETYSIWVKDDFQFLSVRKRKDFREIPLSGNRNIFERALIRFKRDLRKIIYKYPV